MFFYKVFPSYWNTLYGVRSEIYVINLGLIPILAYFFSLEFLHKRLEHSGVLQFQLIEPCATSSERAWWKKEIVSRSATKSHHCTKKKISIKDFFGKCYQLRRELRIWSHLFKKFSVENFIFCAVHGVSDKKEKS